MEPSRRPCQPAPSPNTRSINLPKENRSKTSNSRRNSNIEISHQIYRHCQSQTLMKLYTSESAQAKEQQGEVQHGVGYQYQTTCARLRLIFTKELSNQLYFQPIIHQNEVSRSPKDEKNYPKFTSRSPTFTNINSHRMPKQFTPSMQRCIMPPQSTKAGKPRPSCYPHYVNPQQQHPN